MTVIWSKESRSIFERFAMELKEFWEKRETSGENTAPFYGDQDINYCLELQKERLETKNLRMEYDFVPNGHFPDASAVNKSWSDARYRNQMECRTCRVDKAFFREDKCLLSRKVNSNFYQIITHAQNQTVVGEELYTCPNCGAVTKVKNLQEGCAYCGTFFEISDLFPKVSNFYFIKAYGGTEKEVYGSVKKTMLPFILVPMGIYTLCFLLSGEFGLESIFSMIGTNLGLGVMGGFAGYMVWAVRQIGSLFKDAAKSIPMLVNMKGSAKRFMDQMQQYTPEFSYEYFVGKVVSLLKMMIYTNSPQELPYYEGGELQDDFSDIVDASFSGGVALKEFAVQEGNAYVTVDVYMENFYEKKGRVRRSNDIFRMKLRKNISKPVDFNFSIKKIHCKSCDVSFDATRQKNCPNCGTKYHVDDDDWVVLEVRKR